MSVWSVVVAGVVLSLALIDVDQGTAPSTPAPQQPEQTAQQTPQTAPADDPDQDLVARLDLERYKATIKGLTQFGDRRQGTDRNRAAVDWIEAQLKSYGCANRAPRVRLHAAAADALNGGRGTAAGQRGVAAGRAASGEIAERRQGGGRSRRSRPTGVNTDPNCAARREAARAELAAGDAPGRAKRSIAPRSARRVPTRCTSSARTWTARLGRSGERRRLGHRARDGAGAHLQQPRRPDRALDPLRPLEQRGDRPQRRARLCRAAQALQGKERPAGSGRYPEPKWLGMIQHDMMLFDHGMPRADGTVSRRAAARGRRQHRVPGELEDGGRSRRRWRGCCKRPTRSTRPTIPRRSGSHMTNTDSTPFMDVVAGDQPARERARHRRSAAAGIRTGTSRPTSTRRSPTRTSASASTPRRRRSARSGSLPASRSGADDRAGSLAVQTENVNSQLPTYLQLPKHSGRSALRSLARESPESAFSGSDAPNRRSSGGVTGSPPDENTRRGSARISGGRARSAGAGVSWMGDRDTHKPARRSPPA